MPAMTQTELDRQYALWVRRGGVSDRVWATKLEEVGCLASVRLTGQLWEDVPWLMRWVEHGHPKVLLRDPHYHECGYPALAIFQPWGAGPPPDEKCGPEVDPAQARLVLNRVRQAIGRLDQSEQDVCDLALRLTESLFAGTLPRIAT